MSQEWVSVSEAHVALGVGENELYAALNRGELPSFAVVRIGKSWRISRAWLEGRIPVVGLTPVQLADALGETLPGVPTAPTGVPTTPVERPVQRVARRGRRLDVPVLNAAGRG